MAQNMVLNYQLDATAVSGSGDPGRFRHGQVPGPLGTADVSFGWDSTRLINLNALDSVLADIRRRAGVGAGLK